MDLFYFLESKYITVDCNELIKEYKEIKNRKIGAFLKNNENKKEEIEQKKRKEKQLFNLNNNIIQLFLFEKKSRNLYISLTKIEIKIDSINKIKIPNKIRANSFSFGNNDYFLRTSCIYIFSIVFPFFPENHIIPFLRVILKNITRNIIFRRYYLYIILNSIYKYYLINQENEYFSELTLKNIKNYCFEIKSYLDDHSIIPNREIFTILKTIISEEDIPNKSKEKNINGFMHSYINEEDFENTIPIILEKHPIAQNEFYFKYKTIEKQCGIFSEEKLQEMISSTYEILINKNNFNILYFENGHIINLIINIIFFLSSSKEQNLIIYLLNAVIILDKLQNDLKAYKSNINENIINDVE